MPADLVEDPVLRRRFRFERVGDPDGVPVLRVHIWTDPGGGVTPHMHPAMEERFTVLEGGCDFLFPALARLGARLGYPAGAFGAQRA
jgi:hypothetical protein